MTSIDIGGSKGVSEGGKSSILKTDRAGRVRTPADRRQALLDEFERSGLSGPQFAKLAGIRYQTFAVWVQKRKAQRAEQKPALRVEAIRHESVNFVEAVVDGGADTVTREASQLNDTNVGALTVKLPGGVMVMIADVGQARLAAELVRALQNGLNLPNPC